MTGRATPRRLRFRANGAAFQTAQQQAQQQQQHSYEDEDAAPGTGAIQNKAPALGPAVGSGGSQAPVMLCKRGKNACMLMLCSALDESQSLIHPQPAAVSPSRTRLRSARAGIEALGDGVCEPDMTCHCRGYQQGAMANCRWAARKIRRDSLLPALRR